ncbi:hypothetical protein COI38_11690 [Neisseria meningitidis]|nr:hypothetical protein COI38_11690 [Neisseria meningitidis]
MTAERFLLLPINAAISNPVIPTKVGIQFFEFQSFPINCLSIECLDSRLRGNDESIHTETCIPSFPRKWESRISKASANL